MRKNIIKSVIIHKVECSDMQFLSNKISGFYADIIERKINQSGLLKKQKLEIVDRIIANLKIDDM